MRDFCLKGLWMPQISKMSNFYRVPEILDGEMKDLIFAILFNEKSTDLPNLSVFAPYVPKNNDNMSSFLLLLFSALSSFLLVTFVKGQVLFMTHAGF